MNGIAECIIGGGVRYGGADAVGICCHCSAAVRLDYSRKGNEPGAPLLCLTCAELCPPHLARQGDQVLDRRKA